MDLLIKGQLPVLQKGHYKCYAESDDDRHDIKAHLALYRVYILKIDTVSQIQHQKYDYREQRPSVCLDLTLFSQFTINFLTLFPVLCFQLSWPDLRSPAPVPDHL